MKKNDQINSATAFSPPAPFPALLPPRRIALSSSLRPQHAPCCRAISSPALPTPPIPNPLLRQTSPRASHSHPLAPANFPPPLRPNRALTRH